MLQLGNRLASRGQPRVSQEDIINFTPALLNWSDRIVTSLGRY